MSKPAVRIYHNPRCSKSREVLGLLRERGTEPEVIDYLKTPPDEAAIKKLIKQLGVAPHTLLRTKEGAYERSGLDASSSADLVAKAIAAEPVLLERPVVVVGERAAIGRPVGNVLALL